MVGGCGGGGGGGEKEDGWMLTLGGRPPRRKEGVGDWREEWWILGTTTAQGQEPESKLIRTT